MIVLNLIVIKTALLYTAVMPDLTSFPNQLDSKKLQCRAIIETPKNRRNKFDYDPVSELFELAGLLPEGMMFPFDFGFILRRSARMATRWT